MDNDVESLSYAPLTHLHFLQADLDFIQLLIRTQPNAISRLALEKLHEDLSNISALLIAAWKGVS
jgi:hypothetical protein